MKKITHRSLQTSLSEFQNPTVVLKFGSLVYNVYDLGGARNRQAEKHTERFSPPGTSAAGTSAALT